MKKIKLFLTAISCYLIFYTSNVYALENKTLEIDQTSFFIMIFILFALFTSILLFIMYGRDERFTETIEFYPPEEYNSLEIGFLYKGKANNIDVISLLIYLASLKYLKISDIKEKTISIDTDDGITRVKVTDFKITKLKEYDGTNENEKIFFNGLFQNSKTGNETTCMELCENFYKIKNSILKNINSRENKNKIFTRSSLICKRIIGILSIITYLFISLYPLYNEHLLGKYLLNEYGIHLYILIFPILMLIILVNIIFGKGNIIPKKDIMINKFITKIVIVIITLFFLIQSLDMSILSVLISKKVYLFTFIFGMISISLMLICFLYVNKRNKYGNEILGKIKGFKTFLETAEKNNIEKIVEKNPEYCYQILPYTYVLGVESKWIENFDSLFVLDSMKGFYDLDLDSIFGNNNIISNFINSIFGTNNRRRIMR